MTNDDLFKRIFSSICMIASCLGLIYSGNIFALLCIITFIASTEIYNIMKRIGNTFEEIIIAICLVLGPMAYSAMTLDIRLTIKLLCIIWTVDSGSMALGNSIGGPKFGSISPKKTYAGIFGGILCGIIMSRIIQYPGHIYHVLLICIATQIGDLIESACKRLAYIKDSNVYFSIPGHGGLLDRIDGLLLAFPVGAYLLTQ